MEGVLVTTLWLKPIPMALGLAEDIEEEIVVVVLVTVEEETPC